MVSRINDRSDEMIVAEAISKDPERAGWYGTYFDAIEVPTLIAAAFNDAR